MTRKTTIQVNDQDYEVTSKWYAKRLIDFLRIKLKFTGVKEGCSEGDCGACTVLVDGSPMCACLTLCGTMDGKKVTTIEGLPQDFLDKFIDSCETHGGVQCGFCTGGVAVMSSWVDNGGTETGNETLPNLLAGNICRCGGYQQLNNAIVDIQ